MTSSSDATSATPTGFPEPSLIVLVGPACSGKTTWARARFAGNEIASLAGMRAAVGTGPRDVKSNAIAHELLEKIVRSRLARGLTVVVDSDGLEERSRTQWRTAAEAVAAPTYAVLFATTLDTCLARNDALDEPYPAAVIRRQARRTLEVGEEIASEGFEVLVVRDEGGPEDRQSS